MVSSEKKELYLHLIPEVALSEDSDIPKTTAEWLFLSEAAPMILQAVLLALGAGMYGIYRGANFVGTLINGEEFIVLWLWKAVGGLCFGAWGIWILNRVWPKRHQPTAIHGIWGLVFVAGSMIGLWGIAFVLLGGSGELPVPRFPALIVCGWLLVGNIRAFVRLVRPSS